MPQGALPVSHVGPLGAAPLAFKGCGFRCSTTQNQRITALSLTPSLNRHRDACPRRSIEMACDAWIC